MEKEIQDKIDNIADLQKLINSTAWAKDNIGLLVTQAINIMQDNGISTGDAIEYLEI
jgi:hypothetical protein